MIASCNIKSSETFVFFLLSKWITTELLTGHDSTGYYWAPGPDLPTELVPACVEQLNNEGSEHFLLSHRNGDYQRSAASWTYDWNDVGSPATRSTLQCTIYQNQIYAFLFYMERIIFFLIIKAKVWLDLQRRLHRRKSG